MDYISTTALANELNMKPIELFEKLNGLGWIERKNEKWILTNEGKQNGGQVRTNPKFGEFVVWPENTLLNGRQSIKEAPKFLSSTALSKHFNVSAQRINLILSELGFIEKDVAGWEITKLGKSVGGRQREHETSGGYFVIWPLTILQNKRLLELFGEIPIEQKVEANSIIPVTYTTHIISSPSQTEYHDTFREKFPPKHRTFDGHYVRSISEMSIDNFLYINGIVHAYERKLPIEEDV